MSASNHRCFRSLYVAALALLAACGGTTGFGDLMGVLGDDASSEPDVSARESGSAADATSAPPSDAGAGVDVQGTDPLDATLTDRIVPMRPLPKDTGAPIVVGDASGVGADAQAGSADAGSVWSPDGQTTYTILAAQGPGCQNIIDGSPDPNSCALGNGCLDVASVGGRCELSFPGGTGEIGDPTINCLQTLHDTLVSWCGAPTNGPGTGLLTPCLCGDADTTACAYSGTVTPNGPIYPDYVRSFNTSNGAKINGFFVTTTFGAGMANAVANCLEQFSCPCFGVGSPDAGLLEGGD